MPTLTQKKVYNYTYGGAQPYNYEPVAGPRVHRETRGRINGQNRTLRNKANAFSLESAS